MPCHIVAQSLYRTAICLLWAIRIRITRKLEVEAEEAALAPLSESEAETQPKPSPRRKAKRNRKDQPGSLSEELEQKVCNATLICHNCCPPKYLPHFLKTPSCMGRVRWCRCHSLKEFFRNVCYRSAPKIGTSVAHNSCFTLPVSVLEAATTENN